MKNGYKKYVVYFQKVTTIGVLACGKNRHEALEEAERQMKSDGPIERCFYDETELQLSDSQEWNPDFEIISIDPSNDGESLDYCVKANEDLQKDVAKFYNKSIDEITDDDFQNFFIDAMKEFINKAEDKYGKVE